MVKKRMTLSVVALIGSVFLFVFASFAWFIFNNSTGVFNSFISVKDINIEASLEIWNEDSFDPVDEISLLNQVPGLSQTYRLLLENDGTADVSTRVLFYGIQNTINDANWTTVATKSLLDVTTLTVSLIDAASSEIKDHVIFSTAMEGNQIVVADGIEITAQSSRYLYFTITIDGTLADNDYQNLQLLIAQILIQSVG